MALAAQAERSSNDRPVAKQVAATSTLARSTIITGCLMAIFLANSGGAWDNAKKFVEDGHFGGKYSGIICFACG